MEISIEQINVEPHSLEQLLAMHSDKLIMISKGHSDYTTKKSYYNAVLMYKNNKSDVISEHMFDETSNRCALMGYLNLIKKIKKPMDVILVTDTSLGFKKCLRNSGVNKDLCIQVLNELEKIGVKNVIEILVKGGSNKLNRYLICNSDESEIKEETEEPCKWVNIKLPIEKYEKLLSKTKLMGTTINKVMQDYINEYLNIEE